MVHHVWRIASDDRECPADDLSGADAAGKSGRWHDCGVPLVYAAQSRALAGLESLAHLDTGHMPHNRFLVRIAIPDAIWRAAAHHTPESLPVGWDADPPGPVSIAIGTLWAAQTTTCLLRLPSVIVPEEETILINPAHPDAAQISATRMRRWLYDPRLL